jgi:hypothetical protein
VSNAVNTDLQIMAYYTVTHHSEDHLMNPNCHERFLQYLVGPTVRLAIYRLQNACGAK